MQLLAFVLGHVDANLSIVLETLSVIQVLTFCLAMLALRNGRRAAKNVDALLHAVDSLNRSAQNHRIKERAAPPRRAGVEVERNVVAIPEKEPQSKAAPRTDVGRMIVAALEETRAEIAKTPAGDREALLERIYNEADIVLGVIEGTTPDNPTLYVIKHDKRRRPLTFKAVPCRDLREAELMKRVFEGPAAERATVVETKTSAPAGRDGNIDVLPSGSSELMDGGMAMSKGIGQRTQKRPRVADLANASSHDRA
jgi:hypothetical protein